MKVSGLREFTRVLQGLTYFGCGGARGFEGSSWGPEPKALNPKL